MSGTQDEIWAGNNSAALIEAEEFRFGQSGIGEEEEDSEKLTPSQKMDRLIRGTNPEFMKKEISKLRKESAKYRQSSRTNEAEKTAIQQKAEEIQKELEVLKSTHKTLNIVRKLDKAGCVKSELVAKDIPDDCEDIDSFIEKYKEENDFLFRAKKQSLGGTFKPSTTKALTPSQQMDAFIRAALGR